MPLAFNDQLNALRDPLLKPRILRD